MKGTLLFSHVVLSVLFFCNSLNAQYCTPTYVSGCSGGDGITSFQFGAINQIPILCDGSPVDYYHDYTSQSTDVAQNGIYDLAVSTTNSGTYISLWIDYDNDQVFDNGSELALQFYCLYAGTTSTSLTIPATAALGPTRLRVLSSTNAYPTDPCSDPGNGNCSDFSVNIVETLTAPSVTTLAASGVTAFTAVLNGTVNPNDNFTHAVFNYGTDLSYGINVPGNPWTLTGTSNTDITASVSGLVPNTTYHYEAVGYGSGGYVSGGDMEFTTSALPPTVTTGIATNISGITATLNGSVNANNLFSTVSFEYGLDDTYGTTIDGNPSEISGFSNQTVSVHLAGLELNTLYHYRVVSTNSEGSSFGDDMTFTTLSTLYCIPVYPIGCNEFGIGLTFFGLNTLSQSISCEGTPSYYHDLTSSSTDLAINGYYIVSVTAGYGYPGAPTSVIVWIDYNQDNIFDVSSEAIGSINCYAPGTTYTFPFTVSPSAFTGSTRLRAMTAYDFFPSDPCGSNTYGNCSDFTVNIGDQLNQPSVTTLAATDVSATDAQLNGTVNANDITAQAEFLYGVDASYGNTVEAVPGTVTGSSNTDVSAIISGLMPNTTYNYTVVGYGAGGYVAGENMVFTTNPAPPTVVTGTATDISGVTALLTGTVNANNLSSSVAFEYGLDDSYGSTVEGIPTVVEGGSPQSVWVTILGLEMNTIYHYRVVSTNSEGTSAGADLTFTTLSTPYCIPVFSTGCSDYDIGLTYFALNTIAQSIPCEGTPSYYHDYTSAVTDLAMNGRYSITVQDAGYYAVSISVWIDYNQNNVFDGGPELVGQGYCLGGSSVVIPIVVPESVPTGNTRLRIMSSYYGLPSNPCGSYVYGNCSDFTINITDPLTAPAVTTLDATGISDTDAILNGLVNANDYSTQVEFHYGFDANYGNSVAAIPAVATGNADTEVSAAVTGLMPNTTYHFEVAGFGPGGYVSGGDLEFATNAVPPTVTTENATLIAGTFATLNGTVNANNSESTVSFEYGLDDSYGNTIDGNPSLVLGYYDQSVTANITGLELNTVYHYRIISTNLAGTSTGDDMVFTTFNTLYCVPFYSYGCADNNAGLTYFELNSISQAIPCEGIPSYYHDYHDVSTDLAQNGYYVVSVTAGYGVEGTPTSLAVWIDYNQNNVFDGSSELVGNVDCFNAGSTYTIPFTVSAAALTGTTGLRAMATLDGYPVDPCGSNMYGNCSDFSVNIVAPVTPPDVTTLAATGISESEAVLNGSVNANDNTTHTIFYYGLDTEYGNAISGTPETVDGNSTTDISASISGLTPNTIYNYKLVGFGAGGYISGENMTFVTNAFPPIVTTGSANSISGISAVVNGSVNPNNLPSAVYFEYGLTDSYGSVITGNPSSVSGSYTQDITGVLTGLSLNTTYHYRISSTSSAGTSVGNDMTFSTLPTIYCIPVYSTGCSSYGIGLTYFGLNTISQTISCSGTPSYYHDYTSSSTDLSKNGYYAISVTEGASYAVYLVVWADYNRNNIFDGSSEVIGQTYCGAGATATIYFTVPSSAATGATRLRAMSRYYSYGYPTNPCSTTEVYGNCADFTINITDPIPPASVTTLAATGVTSSAAVLNGAVNANDNITHVIFQYGTTTGYGTTVAGVPETVAGNSTTDVAASISGLLPNTTYYYEVVGYGAGGYVSGGNMTFTTAAIPPAVTTSNATNISGTTASLKGTVNANYSATDVFFEYGLTTSYGTTISGTPSPVTGGSSVIVTGTATGLLPNVTYHYRAIGTNSSGSTTGADFTFTTLSPNTTQAITSAIPIGTVNQQIIGIEILNPTANNAVNVTSFTFNTNGCTQVSDLSRARLYSTGTSPIFSTGGQVGSDITSFGSLGSSFTITGSKALLIGNNYFWLTYDIATGATPGDYVDAECTSITAGGSTMVPATTAPDGNRLLTSVKFLDALTITQASTGGVQKNSTDNEILMLDFNVGGTTSTLTLNSIVVTNTGYATDIPSGGVKLYYTSTPVFATTNPLGTAQDFISGLASFTSLAYDLPAGHTYVWVAYDIVAGAVGYHIVDGKIAQNAIDIQGALYPVTEQNPSGSRFVIVEPKTLPLTQDAWATIPPYDWNKVGSAWSAVSSSYCGGVAPELMLNWSGAYNNDKMITPPLNSTGLPYMVLRFKTFLNNYGTGAALRVQSSANGTTWTNEAWSLAKTTGGNFGPYDVVTTISSNLSGGTTYVAFVVTGNPYYINFWYIDNVKITAPEPPAVTTAPVTSVAVYTAVSGGNVTDDAANPVTARGVCWSTSPDPVISGDHTSDGTGLGIFVSNITGLIPGNTYHVRAYATNGVGTSYGADLTFTPAPPPTVTTTAATAITASEAVLNGIINANEGSVAASFEYGLTDAYGNSITGTPATVTGSSDVPVSASLSGLQPNTTYHYRASGAPVGGITEYGDDMAFTTNAIPPTVSTLSATNISGVSALLNGTVNANNATSAVSFEYGLTNSYGTTIAGIPPGITGNTVQSASVTILGLAMNTTYHYRIVSTNAGGTSYGDDMIFTTLITPYCVPAYTTGCNTYNIGLTHFELSSISQGINCSGTPNYYHDFTSTSADLYQNGSYIISVTCGYWDTYVTVWIDYNQNNVFDGASEAVGHTYCTTQGTTYTIPFTVPTVSLTGSTRLRAMANYYWPSYTYPADPCTLTETYGNCSDFTVAILPPLSPPAVVTDAANGITGMEATLNATVNANGNLTNTTFNWGLTATYGTTVSGVPGTVAGTSDTPVAASLTGLTPSTTYHYQAVVWGIGGTVSGNDMSFATMSIPPTVTSGTVSNIQMNIATLHGTVNPNNLPSTVYFEYGLTPAYGSTITGSPSSLSGYSVQSVTGSLSGLALNTLYHYRIVSTNSAGTSAGDDMTFTSAPTLYCIPSFTTGCNTYSIGLTSFALNTISQAISCSGSPSYYHNYYPSSTDLNKNGNYSISITAGGSYGIDVTVWIDYNQNNVFDGGVEIIGQGHCSGGGTANIPITVNALAPTGPTGLRVLSNYDNDGYPTNPCGSYTYGNCADFMVNILPAVSPPSITTNSASSITAATAVLNATANGNGNATSVTFNYGLTTSYGSTITGVPSLVTGSSDISVSASITALLANTTYHYQAVGTGIGGTVYGSDMAFTTSMIPPTITTTAASNIAGVSAYLNGTVNPNNLPSSVSFEYGLTDSYGTSVGGNPSNVSGSASQSVTAFLSGLTMNTVYHFRVVSANAAGTSYGDDLTFTTLPTLYCIPTYTYGCSNPWYMGLTYVELNTIAQTIPCTGTPAYYHDYTFISTDLAQNGSYTMTVQAGGGYGIYVNVWIDFNQNNYFDGADEIVGQGHCNGGSSATIAVTVPGTALTGNTRIRVMSNYDNYGYPADPCGWNYYGNCADFAVNIMSPGPPIVSTGSATQINISSATLNGLVNPNYFSSTVSFEYGLTDSYGLSIAGLPSPLTGGVNTAVTAALTGLAANTTYHFRVSSTNSAGTSVGDDMTFTTTPTPVFDVSGGGSYCSNGSGLSVLLSGSDLNATYQLYRNAVTFGSIVSGTGNPLSWDNLSDGTYTIQAITSLGNTWMIGDAVISSYNNPVSVAIYASAYTICPGTSVTFTAYPTNGGTTPAYQWKVNNVDVGLDSYQYSYVPNGGDEVTCVLTSDVSCPTGNPATSNTITITVSSPVPGIVGSDVACAGSSGNSYSTEFGMSNYVWNISSGGTITSGGNGYYYVTVTWNTAGAQTVSVNYTNSYSCTAPAPTVKNVSVNVMPVPVISGPGTVCTGSTGNTYSTEPGMSAYSWLITGGTITSGAVTNQITVTWNTSGPQTVSVNYSNGCTPASPTVYNVTVNPNTAPTITGPESVCVNSTGNVYTTETGMSNYDWTVSSGGTITAGGTSGDNTVTVTWNTSGSRTIHVDYTNSFSCGVSTPGLINVTVNSLPVPVVTGPSIICGFPSTGNVYSTEAGKTNYIWSVSAGGTITAGGTSSDNSVTVTWNASGAESVSVNYSDMNNCTALTSTVKSVNVYPIPSPNITGAGTVCLSASGFTYTTESGKSGYLWSISSGGTITSGGGTNNSYVTVIWNTTGAQSVSVNYNNATGCTAPSATIFNVIVNPRPAPSLSGPSTVCAGSTGNTYTTDAGMSNYTWSVPSGGTITSGGSATDNYVVITWNVAGARHVNVNYSNSYGCEATTATLYNVAVNPRPVPVITGAGSICGIPSTGNVYSTESGMSSYIWTISAGGTITAGDGTDGITVDWNTTGAKTITVTYTDANGCTPVSPTVKHINVESIPVPAIAGPALVCGIPSAGNIYSIESGKSGYVWTVSAGGTITAGSGTHAITVSWTTAGPQTVSVTYVTGIGCTPVAATIYDVDVFPFVAADISGPTSVCGIPSVGNIYTTDAGMTGYVWSVSWGGTITAGQGTSFITVSWTTTGSKTVTVTYVDGNGCSPATPVVKNVDVYSLPVPVITGNAVICDVPSVGNVYSAQAGMTGYSWNVSAGGTIINGQGTDAITVTWSVVGAQTVDVIYTDSHGCTAASPTVKSIDVNLYVPVSIMITASANPTCSGSYVNFTASTINGGSSPSYQWKVNGANVGWNSSAYSYVPVDGDIVSCVVNSSLPCTTGDPASSNAILMVVNSHPDVPLSGGNQTVCSTTLPALLSASAPAGSTVDWYSQAIGGGLLLTNSSIWSASAAGTYYAESRNLSTGCKSLSRTAVSLTVNNAIQYFIDLDGDGYGNAEVSLFDCTQPSGYVTNSLDCNDNNASINPGDQYLAYTNNVGFTTSIVSPVTGSSYTLFHFEADYFDATNSLPGAGYPRLILDYEGNGSYTDANDRTVIMTGADPLDVTTDNGKRYFTEVNGLTYGTNWKARVIVSDGVNCTTTFGPFDNPDVLHEPNLYLFANDVSFSDPHPDPSQSIIVSTVVHNESDFDAQNFVCHLVNQWDTLIAYPDVTVANLPAHQNTTVQWNITTPDVPAWCPMKAIVDYTYVIAENNELDNTAVRPFINGNYQIAGRIVVQSAVSPAVSYASQYSYLSLSGRAWYTDLAVQLTDSTVAGATVDFTIAETGAAYTGYTNSWGYFNIYFPAPNTPGLYHINGTVTDFTLTGNFTNEFTILLYIPEVKPNLTLAYCHSVNVQPVNPVYDLVNPQDVTLIARVVNNGNATAIGPIEVRFSYSTGGTWLTQYDGDLEPGYSATVSVTAPVPPPTATELAVYADPDNLITEWNESDWDNSAIDNMCHDFQPVGICGANFWGTHCVNSSTSIYVGVNVYHLYDANPVAVLFEVSGPGISGWQNLGTGILNNVTKNCYCPYVVGIPESFTFSQVGIYTFRMTVDPEHIYDECDEDNNVLVVTVNSVSCLPPETKPNLAFSGCYGIQVQPVNPFFPGMATLVANIVNNGNAIAFGPIDVQFTYSEGTFTGSFAGNLNPGQTAAITVTAPLPVPATTVLTAFIDPANTVDEWSETDNVTSDDMCWEFQPVPHCGYNFWSHTYIVGQSATLSVGVNVRHLYDANPVKVKFEVSGPGILGTQNLGFGTLNNATRNCWCPWVVVLPMPYTFFEAGVYHFTMTVDPDDIYTECDELNNVLEVDVTVIDGADMRILSQFINPDPLNPGVNDSVSLIVSYENIGNTNVNDQMKLKIRVDNSTLDEIYPVFGLATGDHASIAIPKKWGSSLPGAHVIRAIIDADNQVPEINESNNEATRAIIVGECANLYFQLFAPSNSNPLQGGNIYINSRIGNNGDVNATANVKFYYIDDSNDTIPIGQTPVSVFAHDSASIIMPWVVADNSTTLVAKIVDVSVQEFNPDDNIATTTIGGFVVSITSTSACYNENNGMLTAEATGGTAPYLYIWSNGYIGQTLTAGPGNYTVTVTDNTGLSKTASGTIGEFPLLVPSISGPSVSSNGSIGNVYTTESGMNGYTWTVSAGGTVTAGGTATDNSVTVTWNSSGAQNVSVNYLTPQGCTANVATDFGVFVNEVPVPTISGQDSICVNSTGNTYVTEDGMTDYIWEISSGGTITNGGTSSSNFVTVTWTSAGTQTVSVSYTSSNGYPANTPTIFTVTVHPQPVPTITGPVLVCANSSGHVYTTEAGMTAYVWTVSTGGTITAGGTSASNTVTVSWANAGSRTVRVSYTNGFGCAAVTPTILNITVTSLPAALAGNARNICMNSSTTIGAPAVAGNSYSWVSNPAGFTSILANPTVSPQVTTTYTVTETNTATNCSNSHSVVVTVKPLPAAIAGVPRSICQNSSTIIGAAAAAGSMYSWSSLPAGFRSSRANPSVSPLVTTTYTVLETVITTGCTNSHSVVVTVNPLPDPTLSGPTPVCNKSAGNTYTTEASMTNYQWAIPAGATVTAGGGTSDNSVTLTWNSTGTRTIKVNYANSFGCQAVIPEQMNVTVNPVPAPAINGTTACCINANVNYSTVPLQLNYTWTISPGGTINSGQGTKSVNVKWATAGPHWIGLNYTNAGGCSAPAPTIKNVVVSTCKSGFIVSDSDTLIDLDNAMVGDQEHVGLDIYPNPNEGTFTALIYAPLPGMFNLQLYSNLGVKVFEIKDLPVNGLTKQKIDVRYVANGIYTLVLTNKDQSVQKKVLIRK